MLQTNNIEDKSIESQIRDNPEFQAFYETNCDKELYQVTGELMELVTKLIQQHSNQASDKRVMGYAEWLDKNFELKVVMGESRSQEASRLAKQFLSEGVKE